MNKKILFFFIAFALISCSQNNSKKNIPVIKPNIVIIYLDDLGYGDLSCYGATEIHTPNIDKLASEGLLFTDAHSSSATCTPSRYALLTGEYPWRNKNAKILPGTAPLLIDTVQQTLPKMLKKAGYQTAIVGKWHLGLGTGVVDWNIEISPGPNQVGFDHSYIMAATQDRVPTVYIENGYVDGVDKEDPILVNYSKNFEGEPTGMDNPELLTMKWSEGHYNSIVNGISRIGFMKGGEKARWSDVDMADHFLEKAQDYVKEHKAKPFFLYYALQQPHVPRTPHPRFEGKSGMGPRGDVILEADWCIGEFIKTLEEEGIAENTLVIFTSDNGPVLNDGYSDDAVEKLGDHKPWGELRGGKYSLFEAGTRVPFISYWPGKIKQGKSNALFCQIDLLSSLSTLVGEQNKIADSEDLLSVLIGESNKGRNELIIEATSRTAFRKGNWLMIPPYNQPLKTSIVNIELGNGDEYKLYDLKADVGQSVNLKDSVPELLNEMIKAYETYFK